MPISFTRIIIKKHFGKINEIVPKKTHKFYPEKYRFFIVLYPGPIT